MARSSIIVIGSGISGLAAAAVLARSGARVTVLERNAQIGGRARTWAENGFTFDMGPSFYWMPDVFERFFARFGARTADHYALTRLDPSYRIIFGPGETWDLPAGRDAVAARFEQEEAGASRALHAFLDDAARKYALGMQDAVYLPSLSWREYLRPQLLAGLLRTTALRPLRRHVQHHFQSARIRQVLEFPALFLGASPARTPALYSLMNHADIDLGTWYPMGGMGRVMQAMRTLAEAQGAEIRTGVPVTRIQVSQGRVTGVATRSGALSADVVLATADYHHVEQELLDPPHRSYPARHWAACSMAPSTLLFFIGLDRRLPGALHHTLFFDAPFDDHLADVFHHQRWPRSPLFYLSCTSVTDPSTAPAGCENLVLLIPIASGAKDTEELREAYFHAVADRIHLRLGLDIRRHLVVKRSYCVNDLKQDYNAFRGNAYGLASTLMQTGPSRPRLKSRKARNLYFAGQLSVPGPGMPPALISGQVAADLILNELEDA